MSNPFTMTKNYADAQLLLADDLDQMAFSLEEFINMTGINDDNIQTNGLVGSNIATNSITAAKLASNSIATTNLQDDSVTNPKLATTAITTVKLKDSNIIRSKLEALGQQESNFSTTVPSGSGSQVTLGSVTITTTGRPVFLTVPALSYTSSTLDVGPNGYTYGTSVTSSGATTNMNFTLYIFRGVTQIYTATIRRNTADPNSASTSERKITIPSGSVQMIDSPTSGTYTYTLKMALSTTTYNGQGRGRILAYEL